MTPWRTSVLSGTHAWVVLRVDGLPPVRIYNTRAEARAARDATGLLAVMHRVRKARIRVEVIDD